MRADGPPAVAAPVWIEQSEVMRAGVTGIFYPAVERGQTVKKGAPSAASRTSTADGRRSVVAPFDGEVLYVIGTPPITKGEPVAFVGFDGEASGVNYRARSCYVTMWSFCMVKRRHHGRRPVSPDSDPGALSSC